MKKTIILLALMSFGIGCASSSFTKTGTDPILATPSDKPIIVYSKESEISKPFRTLGVINYNNPGKYQILTLASAIPNLKDDARKVGATAIIIDNAVPVKSGIVSTGIAVTARAIKVEE